MSTPETPGTTTTTTTPSTPDVPSTPATDPLAARVATLETKVATLESRLAVAPAGTIASTTTSSVFDEQARIDELRAQGLSEADAITQAAYEKQLIVDQSPPPVNVSV